jgi:hypothetical protein
VLIARPGLVVCRSYSSDEMPRRLLFLVLTGGEGTTVIASFLVAVSFQIRSADGRG